MVAVRVLVVEDASALAEVVAEGLRDQGMAVDVALDGVTAVSKIDGTLYDVVVLDRDLPGVHGDTICQMVTAREPRAMVLMLTASGSADDRVRGLTLGADDYLAKPFHFPELVLRVRALARRRPGAHARTLTVGDLELDPIQRRASRSGVPVTLSNKEFALLEVLMGAAPAYVSSEELLDRVWDEHANPFTNSVTVTVGRLRRKLGDPPAITTQPGIGYRIV